MSWLDDARTRAPQRPDVHYVLLEHFALTGDAPSLESEIQRWRSIEDDLPAKAASEAIELAWLGIERVRSGQPAEGIAPLETALASSTELIYAE